MKLKKVKHIQHTELKLQEYLAPKVTNLKIAKFIYHSRNRILDVRWNYKNKHQGDLTCPLCKDKNSSDSQEHLLFCDKLMDSTIAQGVYEYEHLFSSDVKKQITIGTIMSSRFEEEKKVY